MFYFHKICHKKFQSFHHIFMPCNFNICYTWKEGNDWPKALTTHVKGALGVYRQKPILKPNSLCGFPTPPHYWSATPHWCWPSSAWPALALSFGPPSPFLQFCSNLLSSPSCFKAQPPPRQCACPLFPVASPRFLLSQKLTGFSFSKEISITIWK